MRGLEGKGDHSEGGKGKHKVRQKKKKKKKTIIKKKNEKKKQRDTRTPNEVRPQTSVSCVE